MDHLLELGHRDIAFVAGPPTSPEATARQRAWRDVAAGAPACPPSACYAGDWSSASGYAAGRRN